MIAVTGATGNVGRALVGRLLAAGAPVRALARDPRRLALPEQAEVVRFDPDEPAALFAGATKLFLYAQAGTPALLKAAREQGVRHVVMLSSGIIQEGADETHPIHVMHADAERQVRDSGLAWTFLRPNAFATNALQWAPQIRARNTAVRGVFADALSAPIHEDDIAAVAERALLDDGHEGAAHRLTGPGATTNAEQIAAIGRAVGRELTLVEVSAKEAGPELFPHVPQAMLDRLLQTFEATVGVPPEITGTVEKLTGTPARTFAQWARDHAEDFRPQP
ncbi:FMN-dependent NADH-azoreductase [Streptomyces cellostaticus]|uniref:FMN-dependent NADH-azoreductase n=1 Tax=Streptomyces cellostaticus TaxID=67285 RepID=A0A101NR80_9ACTN|nr:NAD(P)H-binding protein [Streptomyces cellostaticus]KUM97885.1 FMN-dependent NADH-azoreductase [Streptomyces cellostaticus]GHI08467.1 nucleotide-diphosphate-sugar epimerase [Streptomyces cellostaticus]